MTTRTKKFSRALLLCALCSVTLCSSTNVTIDSLTMRNVEALTAGENDIPSNCIPDIGYCPGKTNRGLKLKR